MSRTPNSPERLYITSYRLTRTQIRKVKEMGGSAWLRALISKTQFTNHGRDPIEYKRMIAARNRDIATSPLTTRELAAKHRLSMKRVQQIKRQHRET